MIYVPNPTINLPSMLIGLPRDVKILPVGMTLPKKYLNALKPNWKSCLFMLEEYAIFAQGLKANVCLKVHTVQWKLGWVKSGISW